MVCACVNVFLLASAARSEDFKTTDGREYKNATLSNVEPDGITILMSSGIVKLYFKELPEVVQQKYHYDPVKAAEFTKSEEEKQRAIREQTEKTRKENAEKQKEYWTGHPDASDPSSQGGRLYQTVWIDGKVYDKDKNGLFVECSGKGREDLPGAARGLVLLRAHPNFLMLTRGDHVEVRGLATGTITLPPPHRGKTTLHSYQFSP
jgi:hypothetical protein